MPDDFHSTPALLRDGRGDLLRDDSGVWHMIYNGSRADDVYHATSSDGINWQKDPLGAIYQGAYAPNLVKVGDEYRMYYIHKPASGNWEVHLATGSDLNSLQPSPANPILTNSQAWESSSLFYPYVLQDQNDAWTMFYAGYSTPGRTAMGAATSSDGVHWTKNPANPVLTPTPDSSFDSVYTSSQSVIRDGDVYRMYYAGRIDSIHKYYAIGTATKPVDDAPPLDPPSTIYFSAILADNPVAYWRFEDGHLGDVLNGATARDSVGAGVNGNHPGTYGVVGTSNDGPQMVAGAPGLAGTAVHLMRGSNSSSGEAVIFDALGNLGSHIDDHGVTFEFFFRNLQSPTDRTASSLFGVTNERPGGAVRQTLSLHLRDKDTDVPGDPNDFEQTEIFLRDDVSNDVDGNGIADAQQISWGQDVKNIYDQQWHYIAIVIDPGVPAGGIHTYVDGVELTLTNTDARFPPVSEANFADFDKAFVLGAEHLNGFALREFLINGSIDEFAIYSAALSQSQIAAHLSAWAASMADVNLDGVVDIFDVNLVSDNWGTAGPTGDANHDGIVDIFDVNLISDHWGATAGIARAVPEPSSWLIMSLLGACLVIRIGLRPR